MGKVFVEGDREALERIAAALRSAGLATADIEFLARSRDAVDQLPGNWAAFADMAPELCYADWRAAVQPYTGL